MTNKQNFLIAKFGEKKHLEQLQRGEIFFNSIQSYRNDGTDYRGDSMEGRIPIDPQKIKIFDEEGKDIFERLPRPETAIQSLLGDENLMMFCASAISMEILIKSKNQGWNFKEKFKKNIKDFGKYVLVLYSLELLEHIEKAEDVSGQKINFDSGMILYRDFTDFEHTDEYRTMGSPLDRYFVKGLDYKNQNEWRVIVDGEKRSLETNCGSGFLLKTPPLKYTMLMKTEDLLNSEIQF